MVPWTNISHPFKRHLDRFSHFCTDYLCDHVPVLLCIIKPQKLQEAQLPQGDCAARYVSKFVLFYELWKLYKFQTAKLPPRSFKGIGNGEIRQATYNFLLVFHFNCLYLAPFSRYCHLVREI